jgi:type IV pilus assembly protein PilA
MQPENKADISPIPANDDELLPQPELVPLISDSMPKAPATSKPTFPWGIVKISLSIFLLGYGINWVRFSLFSELANCGNIPEELAGEYKISAINLAQEAYFLEKQVFTKDIHKLDVGIPSTNTKYSYSSQITKQAVFNYAIPNADAYKLRTEYFGPFWWSFRNSSQFKNSVGAVFALPNNNLNSKTKYKKLTTVSIVCNSLQPSSTTLIAPKLVKGVPTCGAGTKQGVR